MVINPIKTKSMTTATRQKHQLSSLPLDLVLRWAKIHQVSEHCLLGITIDNKIRWDSHTEVCKTFSRRVFLLSKLRYMVNIDSRKLFSNAHIKAHIDYVNIDSRKLFSNAHIKAHIDYASVMWNGCSDFL